MIRTHVRALVDLLWPPLCPACGDRAERPREQFCESCWRALRRDVSEAPLSAFVVDGLFLDILTSSKYRRFRDVGKRLAREAAARVAPRVPPGVLVPVPLTPAKRRERGFNQTEDFAVEVARLTGLPVEPGWLRRKKGGRALAGREKTQRESVIRGAFSAPPAPPGAAPSEVLLVDDVFTTGSTADECTRTLLRAGKIVRAVVTMGRARAPGRDIASRTREALSRL